MFDEPYARRENNGRWVWVGGQAGDNLPPLPAEVPASWPDYPILHRETVEFLLSKDELPNHSSYCAFCESWGFHESANCDNDAKMGDFVYCRSHVGPHTTGWCTVHSMNKIPLESTLEHKEAMEEVWAMGLSIYHYCDICHKFIANEDWYRNAFGPRRLTCPEHDDESS